jgi:hypothetical protein
MTLPEAEHGGRLYVIGDIHGRLDLFNELLEKIRDDVRQYPSHEFHCDAR